MAFLSTGENQFWKDLIDKYLFPIDEDKAEKVLEVVLIITFYSKMLVDPEPETSDDSTRGRLWVDRTPLLVTYNNL